MKSRRNLKGKSRSLQAEVGIGLATAWLFVQEGAYVFITSRRQRELDEAGEKIGNNVIGVQVDMSNIAVIDRLYYCVKQQKGQIDILFANADIAESSPMEKITEEHFDKTFSINFKGFFSRGRRPFLCLRKAVRSSLTHLQLVLKLVRFQVFTVQRRQPCDHLPVLSPQS